MTGRIAIGQVCNNSDAICHQPLMDLNLTPEAELLNASPQKILLYHHSQMQLHQMSLTHQALPQNH